MTLDLARRLAEAPAILAPGVYDPLSALLAQQAGFEALYLSGASVAYTQLGEPDVGLVSADHLIDVVFRIRGRVETPLIVDADTGFGNALNTQRTVRQLERAGATAIQIEDQTYPKRCGHLAGKGVVPAAEMVGKVKAAVDARTSSGTLIVARTDALSIEGLNAALDRAQAYREAGADVLFVEAPRDLDQMSAIVARFPGVPLLANMVEGGDTPMLDVAGLTGLGYALVIAPGALVRAMIPMAEEFFASLKAAGSTAAFRERMTDLRGLNARIGLTELMAVGRQYDQTLKPGFDS